MSNPYLPLELFLLGMLIGQWSIVLASRLGKKAAQSETLREYVKLRVAAERLSDAVCDEWAARFEDGDQSQRAKDAHRKSVNAECAVNAILDPP